MKNEIGNEIFGIWRYTSDGFTIDFTIRLWDEKSKHKSFFTKINPEENKIEYEWQALVNILTGEDGWNIEIHEAISTDPNDQKYISLSIVQKNFEKDFIVIRTDDAKDLVFNKIGEL